MKGLCRQQSSGIMKPYSCSCGLEQQHECIRSNTQVWSANWNTHRETKRDTDFYLLTCTSVKITQTNIMSKTSLLKASKLQGSSYFLLFYDFFSLNYFAFSVKTNMKVGWGSCLPLRFSITFSLTFLYGRCVDWLPLQRLKTHKQTYSCLKERRNIPLLSNIPKPRRDNANVHVSLLCSSKHWFMTPNILAWVLHLLLWWTYYKVNHDLQFWSETFRYWFKLHDTSELSSMSWWSGKSVFPHGYAHLSWIVS